MATDDRITVVSIIYVNSCLLLEREETTRTNRTEENLALVQ